MSTSAFPCPCYHGSPIRNFAHGHADLETWDIGSTGAGAVVRATSAGHRGSDCYDAERRISERDGQRPVRLARALVSHPRLPGRDSFDAERMEVLLQAQHDEYLLEVKGGVSNSHAEQAYG